MTVQTAEKQTRLLKRSFRNKKKLKGKERKTPRKKKSTCFYYRIRRRRATEKLPTTINILYSAREKELAKLQEVVTEPPPSVGFNRENDARLLCLAVPCFLSLHSLRLNPSKDITCAFQYFAINKNVE